MDETLDLIWWRIYCICCLCKCALCIKCTHTIQNWQWMKLYLSYISTDNWREGFIVFFAVGSPFASFASHLILICGTAVVSLEAKLMYQNIHVNLTTRIVQRACWRASWCATCWGCPAPAPTRCSTATSTRTSRRTSASSAPASRTRSSAPWPASSPGPPAPPSGGRRASTSQTPS